MRTTALPYATTSIAVVGASLIVATPAAVPSPGTQFQTLQLTGSGTDMIDAPNHLVGLIVGGSGTPIPQLAGDYVADANELYIQRILPGAEPEGVFTPEGASPIYTGVQSLPIDTSIAQGQYMLNTYITQNVDAGNTVAVYGESQSAMISSQVMTELQQEGVKADAVKFVLVGDVDNPDGGWGARVDTSFPAFTTTFDVSTPSDTPYDTSIYIQEYDGFSDLPKYPLNIISDLNALLGIEFVHPTYRNLTTAELDDAIKLPTTPGYDGVTDYYMIPMSDSPHTYIPLLVPLAGIPVVGKPLADLLQPVLTQIVNLGYDNPANEGWDVGQANVPTGFGIFPSLDQVMTAIKNLAPATEQGASAAVNDITSELSHPSSLFSGLASGSGTSGSADLLSSPTDLVSAFTSALSQVSTLTLPALQSLLTLAITVPTNVINTFVDNLNDPLNAIGLAADQAVAQPLAVGAIDLFVTIATINSALGDFGLPGIGL